MSEINNKQLDTNKNFEVHTIPKKFLSMRPPSTFDLSNVKDRKASKSHPSRGKKSSGLKKNLIIGIILIILLGGIMLIGAWFFLQSVNRQPQKQAAPSVVVPPAEPKRLKKEPEPKAQPEAKPKSQEIINLDTDQWLTFANPKYYYTVKYPREWTKTSTANSVTIANDSRQASLKINVSTISGSDKNLLGAIKKRLGATDKLESFTLSSLPSYKYTNTAAHTYTIYTTASDYLYELIFKDTDNPNTNQAYNKILVNFKIEKPEVKPQAFPPAADSDKDNLTDAEELIYGSSQTSRDTDKDGYLDGDEVAHLYDPLVAGDARIYERKVVSTYINKAYKYNIIYPSQWEVKGSNDSVIFQDTQGEFIQVLVQPNTKAYVNITEWYRDNINQDISGLIPATVAGQSAVRTPDGMKVYLIFGDNIYSLLYNVGLRADANFLTTFDMMVKSFKFMNN